jgi:hypothetical protein
MIPDIVVASLAAHTVGRSERKLSPLDPGAEAVGGLRPAVDYRGRRGEIS